MGLDLFVQLGEFGLADLRAGFLVDFHLNSHPGHARHPLVWINLVVLADLASAVSCSFVRLSLSVGTVVAEAAISNRLVNVWLRNDVVLVSPLPIVDLGREIVDR